MPWMTLHIDDRALADAKELSPGRTETEVVNDALRRDARARRRRELLTARERVSWEGELDDLRGRR